MQPLRRGFILSGIFDANPRLQGMTIRGVPIRMMDELKSFVKENDVEMAVPHYRRRRLLKLQICWWITGVRAITEFRTYRSESSENIIVENVHLSEV